MSDAKLRSVNWNRVIEKGIKQVFNDAIKVKEEKCYCCKNIAFGTCRNCGESICEDHQVVYNQFTQIDYDCCVDCAERREY